MNIKKTAKIAIEELEKLYPGAVCSLEYEKPHELLFSVRLSAQCTDARVNIVCKDLYKKYTSLEDFAGADIAELEAMVKPCGFYKVKAQNIKDCAAMLISQFSGNIPDNMEDLLKLPGVGRKSANLILGDIFGKPAVVADTHCIRISGRLGLVNSADPEKVEYQLREILPAEKSNDFCHRLVLFGRDICTARKARCEACPLDSICPKINLKKATY